MSSRYLLWFAQEHVDFRHAEIKSLLSLFDIEMKFVEEPDAEVPFWIVDLDSEESLKKIASRSISLRWGIQLWGRAKTIENLHEALKNSLDNNINYTNSPENCNNAFACPKQTMDPFFGSETSFRMTVETFLKHYSNDEKIAKIEDFSYFPFKGPVHLKNPDIELMFFEYYGLDLLNIPQNPHDVFIGRQIVEGQRHLISKLSLRNRKFIGNTSMDPQLSLLMANQAQVVPGDIIIDPFVGSGSLLVAAAIFGGYVWGSDIDFMIIHARSRPSRVTQKVRERDESIKANMHQYKKQKQYLDVLVSDFSKPLWRDSMKFDAIITDPPYGIRESTEKVGIEKENYKLSPEHLANHVPSKVDYNLPHIYCDLLSFAAKHLHTGKKLVCWYPYYRDDYSENMLPNHRYLKLVGNSEQILSRLTARRLLTYEKLSELHINEMLKSNGHEVEIDIPSVESKLALDFRQKYFSQYPTRREKKLKLKGRTHANETETIKSNYSPSDEEP